MHSDWLLIGSKADVSHGHWSTTDTIKTLFGHSVWELTQLSTEEPTLWFCRGIFLLARAFVCLHQIVPRSLVRNPDPEADAKRGLALASVRIFSWTHPTKSNDAENGCARATIFSTQISQEICVLRNGNTIIFAYNSVEKTFRMSNERCINPPWNKLRFRWSSREFTHGIMDIGKEKNDVDSAGGGPSPNQ